MIIKLTILGAPPLAIPTRLKITDMIASITVMIHDHPLPVKRPQASTNHAIARTIVTGPIALKRMKFH